MRRCCRGSWERTCYKDNGIKEYGGKGEGQILLTGLGQILHLEDDSPLKKISKPIFGHCELATSYGGDWRGNREERFFNIVNLQQVTKDIEGESGNSARCADSWEEKDDSAGEDLIRRGIGRLLRDTMRNEWERRERERL